jgi:hypothetical protein
MRFVLPVLMSLALVGSAFAQTAPRVTIEDDVSHANAVACAGLRAAQVEAAKKSGGAPDTLLAATHEAWMKSLAGAGHDAGKVRQDVVAEAARLGAATPAALAAKAKECEPFEIR